jgi:3-dehydroquinate dehydratase type I
VGRVCIPIVERRTEAALAAIEKANAVADLIELRVDYLEKPNLPLLLDGRRKPFVITHRRKEEGGRYRGDEGIRLKIFEEAVDQRVEYVDVEIRSHRSFLQAIMARQRMNGKRTRIISSFHDFEKTPSRRDLARICDRMAQSGAHIAKIVTFARSWEDNLQVLSLVRYAKERNQEIIAFCMGEKGKMSRVLAPWMGAAWTYASLDRRRASAPGQLAVREMRDLWERLG